MTIFRFHNERGASGGRGAAEGGEEGEGGDTPAANPGGRGAKCEIRKVGLNTEMCVLDSVLWRKMR